tara:strand:+ start:2872 stop:3762 length:891 start_codon:yes stop_codon:yes gene_type:complete
MENLDLVKDLYAVASSDGDVSPEELNVIFDIGLERGFPHDKIKQILFTPTDKNQSKKVINPKEYLYAIVRLILSDGIIRPGEIEAYRRISKRLKNGQIIDELMFEVVVEKYLKEEEDKIAEMRLTLEKFKASDSYKKVVLNDDSVKEFEEELKQLVKDYRVQMGVNQEIPTIVVFGKSNLNKSEVTQLIKDVFIDAGMENQDFKFFSCLDYELTKDSFKPVVKNRLNGPLDLLVVGQHEHSMKGNPINSSIKAQCPDYTMYFQNYEGSLSRSFLKEAFKEFAFTWKNRDKEDKAQY